MKKLFTMREQVTLDKDLRQRLNAHFRKRKISRSEFIRVALINYVELLDAEDRFLNKEGRGA